MTPEQTSQQIPTIHVRLLDEPVPVWRPVQAQMLEPGIYRILESQIVPEYEEWEFQPGSKVRVESMEKSGGLCEIAVAEI